MSPAALSRPSTPAPAAPPQAVISLSVRTVWAAAAQAIAAQWFPNGESVSAVGGGVEEQDVYVPTAATALALAAAWILATVAQAGWARRARAAAAARLPEWCRCPGWLPWQAAAASSPPDGDDAPARAKAALAPDERRQPAAWAKWSLGGSDATSIDLGADPPASAARRRPADDPAGAAPWGGGDEGNGGTAADAEAALKARLLRVMRLATSDFLQEIEGEISRAAAGGAGDAAGR